ncbi:hypothetical protein BOTBODRAFT_524414 [Botryobasidium botryosum FD-172 SS1]|uniref:Uncharacterized protein n=1 Tax=Botryobasidium botryosum (strain FD-172 SS1) TaxID=930990 RepID=A0A067MD57_BOTB1|nr:hypothetical protein BOTBODRAFT_524414 [Botryobasidium botryosum FD-172 SS1]
MYSPISILRFAAAAALLFPSMAMALNPTSTRATGAPSLNPPAQGLTSLIGAPAVRSINTNSERLARGLAPLPPRAMAGRRHHARQEHGSGPGPKKSTPSGAPCQTRAASIAIYDQSGKQLGYVADDVNEFGEYVSTQESMTALKISYKQCGATGVPIEITQTNTCGCMPYKNVGAIQGYSSTSVDLAVGSFNYLFVGGVTSTPGLSTPVSAANSFTHTTNIAKSIESDVWVIDATTMDLSIKWVNKDGSYPIVHWALSGGILIATGDISAFTSTFPGATGVTLKVVPAI